MTGWAPTLCSRSWEKAGLAAISTGKGCFLLKWELKVKKWFLRSHENEWKGDGASATGPLTSALRAGCGVWVLEEDCAWPFPTEAAASSPCKCVSLNLGGGNPFIRSTYEHFCFSYWGMMAVEGRVVEQDGTQGCQNQSLGSLEMILIGNSEAFPEGLCVFFSFPLPFIASLLGE